jgi:pimeloyl-ACP methyl ester carboxylesterase
MTSKTITLADGATIAYRQLGNGPGLIIVHGGLETWRSYSELAEMLSDTFTVYVPDRRGRGLSSPPGPEYGMRTEVDDIEILARETGARFIFGVSSGALISLQASLQTRGLFKKAAIFEPPLLVDRERFNTLYERFQGEVAKNDIASSLITGMKITEMGPIILRSLPYWLGKPVINWFLSHQESKDRDRHGGGSDEDTSPALRILVPTMICDFTLVKEMEGALENFTALRDTEVLLLSGTASRPFLIHSCEELERVIPGATHTRLQGLTHLGAGNKDVEGKPGVVAKVLREFFTR